MDRVKDHLFKLLTLLRKEQILLEHQKNDLVYQQFSLARSRKVVAGRCLEALMPNRSMSMVRALRKEVPGFQVPTVASWFGLRTRVDPSISVHLLRMKLGEYLDNTKGTVPDIWKNDVQTIDGEIRNLQEHDIPENAVSFSGIAQRIVAVKRLIGVDVKLLSPTLRAQLKDGAQLQVVHYRVRSKLERTHAPPTHGRSLHRTSSLPATVERKSMVDDWFWQQLLSGQSLLSQEVDRITSGASKEGSVGDVVVQTPLGNHADVPTLSAHTDLGSQSFS